MLQKANLHCQKLVTHAVRSIIYIVVGSLASEFLGWSWKTYFGIPTLDIGIPT